MTSIWRYSSIGPRHREMGSSLEDWSGMGTAWTYDKDQNEEYMAIRTKAGFMDVSGLKKLHISGPHATHVIDRVTTRRPDALTPGRSVYACVLNDDGFFVDDCIIYRYAPNTYMLVHGSGTAREQLMSVAEGLDVDIRFDDNLHDISLQGPLAVDFLDQQEIAGIRDLAYFGIMHTKLWEKPVTITRTGYTGERGYEIFCRAQDALEIWDTLVEKGAPMGIIPTRFTTLDLLRAESYLLFFPYDNSNMYPFPDQKHGDTLWELGLDFTVSKGKTGFIGAEEHYRLKGKERFKIYGVKLEGTEAAEEGAPLLKDGKEVGVVTIGMYSPINKWSVGIARMPVDCAVPGTKLTVKNSGGEIACVAAEMPFHDPEKKLRSAKG